MRAGLGSVRAKVRFEGPLRALIYKAMTRSCGAENILALSDLERRVSACRAERPITVRASPKRERDRHGIDFEPGPPYCLIAVPVKLVMMEATHRNRKLIADLAAQRTRLRKSKMMRV